MKKKTFHSLQLLFIKNKNSQVKLCSVSGDTKSSSASTRSSRAMVLLQLLWSFEGGGGGWSGSRRGEFFLPHRQTSTDRSSPSFPASISTSSTYLSTPVSQLTCSKLSYCSNRPSRTRGRKEEGGRRGRRGCHSRRMISIWAELMLLVLAVVPAQLRRLEAQQQEQQQEQR